MVTYTRKNPDGTYRVPLNATNRFRLENDKYNGAFFGDFIDKLGRVEELKLDEDMLAKLARVPERKLKEFLKGMNL